MGSGQGIYPLLYILSLKYFQLANDAPYNFITSAEPGEKFKSM